ncbi:unnamed protein product [Closterium sp. NIES-65]|nr:unnamed protein product [Closterium sp. NIES-65]
MLTRKIHSATIGRGEGEDEEEEEEEDGEGEWGEEGSGEESGGSEGEEAGGKGKGGEKEGRRLVASAKARILRALEGKGGGDGGEGGEGDGATKSGLFALPFMAKAIERRRLEAQKEAIEAIKDLEEGLEGEGYGDGEDGEGGKGKGGGGGGGDGWGGGGWGEEEEEGERVGAGRRVFGNLGETVVGGEGQEERDEWVAVREGEGEEGEEEEGGGGEDVGVGGQSGGGKSGVKNAGRGGGGAEGKGGRLLKEEREAARQVKAMLGAGKGFSFSGVPVADNSASAPVDVSAPPLEGDLEALLRHTGSGGEKGVGEGGGRMEGGEEEEEEEGREEGSAERGEGGERGKGRVRAKGGEGGKRGDGSGNGAVGVMQGDYSESEREDGEEDIDDGVAYNEGMRLEGKGDTYMEDDAWGEDAGERVERGAGVGMEEEEERGEKPVGKKRKGRASGTGEGEGGGEEGNGASAFEKGQDELMRLAFAGDDVAAEFEAEKERVVEKEVGREEGPVTLPGWGQWEEVQRRKGAPKWIEEEREKAKRRRMDAVKQRADSKLTHVIVSEKDNKKIEKFFVPELPNMFRNRAEYARSIRNPIGRDFNTEAAFRSMTRPAVMKLVGVVIRPV